MADETFFDLPDSPEEFGLSLSPADLNSVDFTALEWNTIRRALIEYTKNHYPDNFNDFATDNSFIMISELISYIGSILALRGDIQANEGFLPTSLSERAVSQHLKLVGEKIKSQTPATVPILCTIGGALISDLRIAAGTRFSVASPDGDTLYYEVFRSPSDFSNDIVIPKGKFGTVAFGIEGSFSEPFSVISTGEDEQEIRINANDVLESPVFVDITTASGNTSVTERWTEIDIIERANVGDKVYELRFEDNGFTVVFGGNEYGKSPEPGRTITVTYRTGGGIRGRITTGIIDENRTIIPEPPLAAPVVVRFRNAQPSEGGTNKESIESAKRRGPIEAATHNAIVSGEDYTIKANSYSHPVYGTVLKSSATLRSSINANQVELYVLASGAEGEPVKPSLGLKNGLKNYLSDMNVFTDEVLVFDGNIKSFTLKADVVISKNVDAATTRSNVTAAIEEFFSVDNFDIGKGFKLSSLYTVIQNVDGVKFVRIKNPSDDIVDSSAATTSTSELAVGYSELLVLDQQQITYYLEPSSQQRLN